MGFKPKEILPGEIEIGGEKYPAIFSNRALILAEDKSGKTATYLMGRAFSVNLSMNELAALIYGAMKEAGDTELKYDDLLTGILPAEIPTLIGQLVDLLVAQIPTGEKKTGMRRAK
jgi:hypothetical protein